MQIVINGATVGVVGLNRIFQRLFEEGARPEDALGDRIIALVEAHNYVPRSARAAYKAALVDAYVAFCTQERSSTS